MANARAVDAFRELHQSGCFVIPNPWDAGSARFLESIGFKALATTSAGFAFTRAAADDLGAVSLQATLQHCAELAAAVSLPVNADFQNAFADEPAGVAENVVACARTGVAGLSVEDATGRADAPLYERALAIERVRAARAALDQASSRVVLTARCEAALLGVPDAAKVAIDRAVAFAEAGADCLFAPGLKSADDLGALVRAVAPKPVNALVSAPIAGLTFARLAELGVRRISVGSALARVAWGAFMRAARSLADGSFEGLANAATFAELNALFRK